MRATLASDGDARKRRRIPGGPLLSNCHPDTDPAIKLPSRWRNTLEPYGSNTY